LLELIPFIRDEDIIDFKNVPNKLINHNELIFRSRKNGIRTNFNQK